MDDLTDVYRSYSRAVANCPCGCRECPDGPAGWIHGHRGTSSPLNLKGYEAADGRVSFANHVLALIHWSDTGEILLKISPSCMSLSTSLLPDHFYPEKKKNAKMPAVKKHRLLRQEKELTYSDVKDEEVNILNELQYFEKQTEFITGLAKREGWIKSIVAHHLNIKPSRCNIADSAEWLKGSFNVCIPVTVQGWRGDQPQHRVLLRVPLPFKLGEAFRPGNADEKIRCEAGTYAWLQENHPDIPIPQLYGFSLSSGETVSLSKLYII